MNKPLYSLSYTCVTAGVAGLLFAGIYLLVWLLKNTSLASFIICSSTNDRFLMLCF